MKVVFLTSRFPYPVEKGDKLRAFEHIRHLSRQHDVHLLSLSHQGVSRQQLDVLSQFCQSIHVYRIPRWRLPLNITSALINGLPAQIGYFLDRRCKREVQNTLIKLQPDHLVAQLIRTAQYVRTMPFPKTLDYMDAFSFGARQRARSGALLLRPFFALESKLLRKYERQVYADFTHHTVISRQDRSRLPLAYRKSVVVLANGVDTDYFSPIPEEKKRWDVVFVGNMGYRPNIEAARYLVKKIMPHVWKERPETTVCLAGARPHKSVRALADRRVAVTGWVDDIRSAYAAGRVFVAPMFTGMGQQNKILEAMAMGLPCVTTSIVNNAIGAVPRKQLFLAEAGRSFADNILELLGSPALSLELAQEARAFAETAFCWDEQNKVLDSILYTQENVQKLKVTV